MSSSVENADKINQANKIYATELEESFWVLFPLTSSVESVERKEQSAYIDGVQSSKISREKSRFILTLLAR